ncbi:nicotianamine synthase-like [Olea europaea subsp. europaea]|uniref:Nicotianamine synthase n=1 Tax=Olea europaea subsp. europaea TaxID=158383 RepID=A0A8S0VE52_OLEEU|nr:nicotianamine synthase-like [Olea europaea subsp. europaea]
MVCLKDPLVQKICEFYEKISRLDSLKPSEDVNMLLTDLVFTCMPPYPIDCTKLCKKIQEIRSKLIRLCGEAEGLLEEHYSTILGSFDNPLEHLHIFPYFSNYVKLSLLEFNILSQHSKDVPSRVAFVGSGPLPLTSIVLASNHMTSTTFHNYDIDSSANSMASHLLESDPALSKRMIFHTTDIMNVTSTLKDYDVIFLAALVGMNKEEKVRILEHLNKHMAPEALLMLRSAHGARAFLYPVVEPCDLRGFEVLSVFHPADEVINSVIIARKSPFSIHSSIDQGFGPFMHCSKCAEIQVFNPLSQMNMIEELAVEEHHC